MHIKSILTGVTGTMLFAAVPAAAVVKIATYRGTVSVGYDHTGVFGAANTDLTGARWVATHTYDKTLGGDQYTDGVSYDQSFGGVPWGTPGGSPVIAATITINGVTKSIATAWGSYIYTQTSSPYAAHSAYDYYDDGVTYISKYVENYAEVFGVPGSLDQNFGPSASFNAGGYALWYNYDYSTSTFTEYAWAELGSDAVYSVGNAVPEPASWALMIAGFGMVGAALRGRRSTVRGVA